MAVHLEAIKPHCNGGRCNIGITEYEYNMATYQAQTLPGLIARMEQELERDPDNHLTAERLSRTREHLRRVEETIAAYRAAHSES